MQSVAAGRPECPYGTSGILSLRRVLAPPAALSAVVGLLGTSTGRYSAGFRMSVPAGAVTGSAFATLPSLLLLVCGSGVGMVLPRSHALADTGR